MKEEQDFSIAEFFLKKKEILSNDSVFIDKPVTDVINRINESKESKILLSGPEDSGKKLTTLKYMDTEKDLFVYFSLSDLDHYNLAKQKNKAEAYIESIVAGELLKILSNLGLESQMLRLGINMPYIEENIDVLKNYGAGDLISGLIYRIRKLTDERLIFVVDKIDTFSESTQRIIAKYFDIFDQTIIMTSDEIVYNSNQRRTSLKEDGFDIINVDYAKDPEILTQIIDARINYHNEHTNSDYKLRTLSSMLDKDVIEKIAVLANGNIRKILCSAKLVYSKCNRESENKDAVGKYILDALNRSNNIHGFTIIKTLYL